MDNDLRGPMFSRGTKVVAAIVVGILAMFALVPRYLDYRRRRDNAEREAIEAPFRAEQKQLEQQLAARFAPIVSLGEGAPETCRAPVTGALPVLERDWLVYAVSRGEYPNAPNLSSPALEYWTSRGGLAEKSAAERDLLAAKSVAIFTLTANEAIKPSGESTFEGGTISGDLVIVDVETHTALCHAAIDAKPTFVVAVRQDTAEGDKWAMNRAEGEAREDAFWTDVEAKVARLAPGARVLKAR